MSILKQNATKNAKASAAQGAVAVGAALGGGLLGAAVGRASLLVGVAAAAAGKYYNNDYITAAGLGMAAGGFTDANATRVNGIEGVVTDIGELGTTNMTAARDRVNTYMGNMRRRLYVLGDVDGFDGFGSTDEEYQPQAIAGLDGDLNDVDNLIDDMEQVVGELSDIAGLGDLDGEEALLEELANIAEDIIDAVEEEGQLTGLDGEDEAALLDALEDLVETIDGLDGLGDIDGLGELDEILADIGELLGWDEETDLAGDIAEEIAALPPAATDMFLANTPESDFEDVEAVEVGSFDNAMIP